MRYHVWRVGGPHSMEVHGEPGQKGTITTNGLPDMRDLGAELLRQVIRAEKAERARAEAEAALRPGVEADLAMLGRAQQAERRAAVAEQTLRAHMQEMAHCELSKALGAEERRREDAEEINRRREEEITTLRRELADRGKAALLSEATAIAKAKLETHEIRRQRDRFARLALNRQARIDALQAQAFSRAEAARDAEEQRQEERVDREETSELIAELAGALALGYGEELTRCPGCIGHLGPRARQAVREAAAWAEDQRATKEALLAALRQIVIKHCRLTDGLRDRIEELEGALQPFSENRGVPYVLRQPYFSVGWPGLSWRRLYTADLVKFRPGPGWVDAVDIALRPRLDLLGLPLADQARAIAEASERGTEARLTGLPFTIVHWLADEPLLRFGDAVADSIATSRWLAGIAREKRLEAYRAMVLVGLPSNARVSDGEGDAL